MSATLTSSLLRQLAEENLPTDPAGLFIVDAQVSPSPVRPKARVVIDGDEGVDVEACATLSRRLGRLLDEQLGEDQGYVLEVTSPGADLPLVLPRQFPRHIGRTLAIIRADDTELTGTLRAVTPEGLELAPAPPKRGKYKQTAAEVAAAQPASISLPFSEVKQATVVISFS